MKILVTGSRYGFNQDIIRKVLEAYKDQNPIIVHGGAKGVDLQADAESRKLGYEVRFYLPDWDRYGKSAGVLRNQQMIDMEHLKDDKIDLCLAFIPIAHSSESRGTRDMMRRCELESIKVILYQ